MECALVLRLISANSIGVNAELRQFSYNKWSPKFARIESLGEAQNEAASLDSMDVAMNQIKSTFRAFVVALLATVLMAVLRRIVVVPIFDFHAPLIPALWAVILAAWIGGLKPSLFATALNAGLLTFFLDGFIDGEIGFQLLTTPNIFRLIMFVILAGLIGWGIESLRASRQRLEDRQEELELEVHRRKRAEAELAEREERVRLAVESAEIGTWDFKPLTGEQEWSSRAKVMFGLSADAELSNVSFRDRVHPEDRERVDRAVQKALDPSGDGVYEIDCRLVWPDNSIHWFIAKGQAIFEGEQPNRRANRLIGAVRDITERKLSEQALRQAEESFRNMATHAPVGIILTDDHGRRLFVNEAWCAITGAKPAEALGEGWQRFLHPDDRQKVVEEWQDAALHGRDFVQEFRFVNQEAGIRWCVTSAKVLLDPQGVVFGYVGTVVDLTDRKASEDRIRASEGRLQAIIDNTSAVIYLKDAQGRYLLINRRYEELFNITQQIIGKTDADIFPSDIVAKLQANDQQVIDSGQSLEFEEVVPQPDGPHTFVSVKFPVIDPVGQCIAVGGISTDISDRKRAADALEEEQETLRHTIKVQDQERQLIAYDIHDGLVQYAAGALMKLEGIKGRVESATLAEQIGDVVDVLRRTLDEGRRIINGIHATILDDCGVVAAVQQLIEDEDRANVKVEFIKDERLGRMSQTIELALYHITQEALTNIRKHSHSDKVRIELNRLEDRVHLEVRDWGVGYTPTTNKSKGVHGLRGMAERARIAGGTCTVQNASDKGTQVIVDLPYLSRN